MNTIKRQHGATLIVSIIFLLILTVIGLAGIEVTGLEEKMAGNMRDRNLAFQSAESALVDGESFLEGFVVLPAFDGTDGLYDLPGDGSRLWDTVDWTSSSAVKSYSGSGFDELSSPSAYIIENLAAAAQNDSLEVGAAADTRRFYRVTSRATGQSTTAVVMLQSVYKR